MQTGIQKLVDSIVYPFLAETTSMADIALVPGGFKPPHAGHFEMIQFYTKKAHKVIVLISDSTPRFLPTGKKITGTVSKALITAYCKAYGITNVEIRLLSISPVKAVYDFIAEEAQSNQSIILGVSDKDEDSTRFRPAAIEKYNTSRADIQIIPFSAVIRNKKVLSATDMRAVIAKNDEKGLMPFLPQKLQSKAKEILAIINKNLVEDKMPLIEGGNAVKSRPIKKDELEPLMKYVTSIIFPMLKLKGIGSDVAILGSYNKKGPDQTYGDIDLAIHADTIAGANNISFQEVLNFIYQTVSSKFECKLMKGFNQVSVSVPIPNTNSDFAQVDFMLSTSLEWSQFAYHSPDFTKAESQYKGVFRNILLQSIFTECFKQIKKQDDSGNPTEYDMFVMRMDQGIYSLTKTLAGKTGITTTAKIIPQSVKRITNVPQDAINLIFDNTAIEELSSFEKVLAQLNSSNFKFPEKRSQVISKFKEILNNTKLPVPKELENVQEQSKGLRLENTIKTLLLCGGAAGHMTHPYEDTNLTFVDLKNIIDGSLGGTLHVMQEKLDGMNLLFSWKDGRIIGARNKQHLKNAGENGLTTDQVKQLFANRENIKTAFSEAMVDFEAAVKSLTPEEQQSFFMDGRKFVNVEILFPSTDNIIPYGATVLNMHHFREYDEAGNQVKEDHDGVVQLQRALEKHQATQQKTFKIKISDPAKVESALSSSERTKKYYRTLSALKKEANLSDNATISDYLRYKWDAFITSGLKNTNGSLTPETRNQLLSRWADGSKSTTVKTIIASVTSKPLQSWIIDTEKNALSITNKFAQPFETMILSLGVDVLRGMKNLVVLNPDQSTSKIKQTLDDVIKQVMNSNNQTAIDVVKKQLNRLNQLGGMSAVLPSEGIVFKYNNKLYKLTGSFAPINQIINQLNKL